MRKMQTIIAFVLVFTMIFALTGCGQGDDPIETTVPDAQGQSLDLEQTAAWLLEKVPKANTGSVGGEWLILGLARSDAAVSPEYFERYYENLAAYTAELGGVLHERRYTEYSRVILAVTAIGKDPADVGGYNLLTPLSDYEQTVFQGINGAIYALLALDCGNYEIPQNPYGSTQATRELYVDYIMSQEVSGGGWALTGDTADVDVTAMALQALAKYRNRKDVKDAITRALTVLSDLQNENGGYAFQGTESSESICQVITALTELGISLDDARFIKNGRTLKDRLLDYQADDGGFCHVLDDDSELMATEQAFYAMAALERMERGENSLYDMTDVQ